MRRLLPALLPIAVLIGALLGLRALFALREVPEVAAPAPVLPLVDVIIASETPYRHTVRSQGTVRPLGEIDLVPEVGGEVIAIRPELRSGAFFREGDLLLEIDPEDLARAATIAEAELRAAELALATEEALASVAGEEWDRLRAGDPSGLALREPQVRAAQARLAAARARHEQTTRDLARTGIVAPFAGRTVEVRVDAGQVIAPGTPIARLHRTDFAEVALPVRDEELASLRLPLAPGAGGAFEGPPVALTARFAGAERRWEGRIRRVEAEIDPRTRLVHLVAEVADPYRADGGAAPLAPGLFVEAEIEGRSIGRAVVLPRAALHEGRSLLVVGPEGRIEVRTPEIARRERDTVVISGGIAAGERVVVTPLEIVVDGMRVEVRGEAAP